jgi:hypothetical protein
VALDPQTARLAAQVWATQIPPTPTDQATQVPAALAPQIAKLAAQVWATPTALTATAETTTPLQIPTAQPTTPPQGTVILPTPTVSAPPATETKPAVDMEMITTVAAESPRILQWES